MYKSKKFRIITMPRKCGKSTLAKEAAREAGGYLITPGNFNFSIDQFRGYRVIIIDDLPPQVVLSLLNDPKNYLLGVDEVYYFHTFMRDPKENFVPFINRVWDVRMERSVLECIREVL